MNPTLAYIAKKFELDLNQRSPIEIIKINRTIMAQTLAELGFTVGAEIGVADGTHAEILCKNNPDLKLYCVDVWDNYPGYPEYVQKIHKYYRIAKERLANYNCVMVKKLSMDALKDFDDLSLDFVYIDGAHDFFNVAMDVCAWGLKVKVGGIIFGHDYKRRSPPSHSSVVHVKDVMQAFTYSNKIRPWFVLGQQGNHPDGMYKEGTQSWMYVKTQMTPHEWIGRGYLSEDWRYDSETAADWRTE